MMAAVCSLGKACWGSAGAAVSYWQGTHAVVPESGGEASCGCSSVGPSARIKSSCQRKKRSREFLDTRYSFAKVSMPCSSAKTLAPSPTRALGGTRRRLKGLLLVSRMSLASEIGFRISADRGSLACPILAIDAGMRRTRDRSTSATASEMVDNGGIALDSAVDRKVGTVTCVCDLLVLEYSQGGFNGFRGTASGFEKFHAHLNGARGSASAHDGMVATTMGTAYETQASRWTCSFW